MDSKLARHLHVFVFHPNLTLAQFTPKRGVDNQENSRLIVNVKRRGKNRFSVNNNLKAYYNLLLLDNFSFSKSGL